MSFTLRPVRSDDVPGVADTVHDVYDEYGFTWEPEGYHADLHDLSAFEDPSYGRFWVAEVDGVIVGVGGIGFHDKVPGELGQTTELDEAKRICGTDCEVIRMYVRPAGRRKGIGSAIMQEILRVAREEGKEALEIWSDKRFEEAQTLYQKHGAIRVADRICDDPDISPEWGYYLPL